MSNHTAHYLGLAASYRQMAESTLVHAASSTDPEWIAYLGARHEAHIAQAQAYDAQARVIDLDARAEALRPMSLRTAESGGEG